jgi:hypothetical protein
MVFSTSRNVRVSATCALVYVFMVPGKPIDVAAFGGEVPAPV